MKTPNQAVSFVYFIFAELRRLGDSEGMYGKQNLFIRLRYGIRFTFEHAYATEPDGTTTGTRPDKIYERPELYVKYVADLAEMMALKYKKDINGFDVNKFKELAEYARSKRVSLLGIINYEVAKMQGQSTFFVHKPLGPEMVSPMKDYQDQVANTKEYLDSKGVKYTTEEVTKTRKNGEKVVLGTRFNTK